jgi:hypothetical protein
MSTFPWLDPPRPAKHAAARRIEVAERELRDRAGVYYRLGFTAHAATERLVAHVAWEFDPPSKHGGHGHVRPAALSDEAIAALVKDTYARRPA